MLEDANKHVVRQGRPVNSCCVRPPRERSSSFERTALLVGRWRGWWKCEKLQRAAVNNMGLDAVDGGRRRSQICLRRWRCKGAPSSVPDIFHVYAEEWIRIARLTRVR